MARAAEKGGLLKTCPTCGTSVGKVNMGLRDFRWVNEALPGRVGGMDLDFCVTQNITGRVIFLELKPGGAPVSRGARLTFALFAGRGDTCWVVWDLGDGMVERGVFDKAGRVQRRTTMTQEELAEDLGGWWDSGLEALDAGD